MVKIVILTGSDLRHSFFRMALANHLAIEVVASYCEGNEKSLETLVSKKEGSTDLQKQHLLKRKVTEEDFFGCFVKAIPDKSHPISLKKGDINNDEHVTSIIELNPDIIVAYGCSIIKGKLLEHFKGRIINVHLGLSPYYRGSGTNFWPLVNGEPEYVGVTFMHMDAGVDTGEIIHQMRANIYPGDGPHQIGNRLIRDMVDELAQLVVVSKALGVVNQPTIPENTKYYRKKDFTEVSVESLYKRFNEGMVDIYLAEQAKRNRNVPIVTHPTMSGVAA